MKGTRADLSTARCQQACHKTGPFEAAMMMITKAVLLIHYLYTVLSAVVAVVASGLLAGSVCDAKGLFSPP